MFSRIDLLIKNHNLNAENLTVHEENKRNREDIEELKLQVLHAKNLAELTLDYLNDLEEIDRLGISEESKRKHRNTVINQMRYKNLDIIKELDVSKTY